MAASAQLAVPATAAREFDARTALQEMRKAAEYQSALAKAIEAKPAARSPAAASFALFVEVLLLFFLGWMDEKRAEPVPEGKEARPGEEEEEEEAAAAANVVVPLTPYRYHAPRDKYLAPILSARPLQGMALGAVTSVKLSATGSLVVLGYGGIRRDDLGMQQQGSGSHAPVVAEVYATEGMEPVRAIRSAEDDVNIARFHPFPGHGFLYGTKQGRVCMLVRGHGGLEEEEAWW